MTERPTSAAASIYPHLKVGTPEPVQRPQRNESVAAALYPALAPQPPQPQPAPKPIRSLELDTGLEWS